MMGNTQGIMGGRNLLFQPVDMPYAVVVAGSPVDVPVTELQCLCEHASVVVAVDSGAHHLLKHGVTPSILVGDLDSIEWSQRRSLESSGVEIQQVSSDKDVTDLALALQYVREQNLCAHVFGALGGRSDHSLVAFGDCARYADVSPVLYGRAERVAVLSAAHRDCLVLKQKGVTFSMIPLLGSAQVSEEGVRWPLDYATLEALSGHGLSNQTTSSEATCTVHQGIVALVVNLGL